jgi:signal recognition particle receptor subunit beta
VATLDKQRDLVVVRIVYDGPPLSGKTTTVRTLADGLDRRAETPEEVNGRTLFFDWVDYVGGMFEGHRIRCQIVTVPGQDALSQRRKYLLSTADSVVFVADTTRPHWEHSRAALEECIRELGSSEEPSVGVVLQANKRDAEDAVPKVELRNDLSEYAALGIVESVATDGRGVREAFVFGVRLALDRVRELIRTRRIREGKPDVDAPDELMAALRAAEAGSMPQEDPSRASLASVGPSSPPSVSRSSDSLRLSQRFPETASTLAALEMRAEDVQSTSTPALPDSSVPSGRIWPPVDGRVLLHSLEEVTVGRTPMRTYSGDWLLVLPGARWLVHSHAGAEFEEPRAGEEELLSWARLHAMSRQRLSDGRCIVLAQSAPGRFRLWQIVKQHPSVEELVTASLISGDSELAASTLLESAALLSAAYPYFDQKPCRLPCSAATVGHSSWQPAYLGLVPEPRCVEPASERPLDLAFVSRELRSLVQRAGAQDRFDPDGVLGALARLAAVRAEHHALADSVRQAFSA